MDTTGLEPEVIKVFEHIKAKQNFVLSGGAGSGKTFSLVSIINTIFNNNPTANIACITYTNAAVDEIKSRVENKNLMVKTIHDFLWEMIKPFKKELKQVLKESIELDKGKDKGNKIFKNINEKNGELFIKNFDNIPDDIKKGIEYKEYLSIKDGIISHDEVIVLANQMFKKYQKLKQILNTSFDYIFIDEYQDTSPKVVEIFLDYFKDLNRKSIIGFFGDSMQAIYDDGVGDLKSYIDKGLVYEVKKEQNRRNPQLVINLANKIRTDGLKQEPSNDINAPNMENGQVKKGSIKFLYSYEDICLDKLKSSKYFKGWNFDNGKETKQLMLTHRLIANQNNFTKMYNIYDNSFIQSLKEDIERFQQDKTVEKVIEENNLQEKLQKIIARNTDLFSEAYEIVKNRLCKDISNIYIEKEQLISIPNENSSTNSKRDALIEHLMQIQTLIKDYENKQYNEVIRKISFNLGTLEDKKTLKEKIDYIKDYDNKTIADIIEFADKEKLLKKDDKLNNFLDKNWYLYELIKNVPYSEVVSLYDYVSGFTPFSTQHKIKGEEFNNVLIVLDEGKWTKYNFDSLFNEKVTKSNTVIDRTRKLFYVCCTRAKENLVIYMNIEKGKKSLSENILENAKELFGEDNCQEVNIKEI